MDAAPTVQTIVITFPWVYGPATVTPGTSWTTILESYWATTQELGDHFLLHWDAMVRNALPGTYFAVKMTLQHDGEAKQTLGFEIGSRPAGGWSIDSLAAGIFPMSFTRSYISTAVLTPFTVRIEVYANPGGLDVMWQTLTGTYVRM